jgi:hypothetical protein
MGSLELIEGNLLFFNYNLLSIFRIYITKTILDFIIMLRVITHPYLTFLEAKTAEIYLGIHYHQEVNFYASVLPSFK